MKVFKKIIASSFMFAFASCESCNKDTPKELDGRGQHSSQQPGSDGGSGGNERSEEEKKPSWVKSLEDTPTYSISRDSEGKESSEDGTIFNFCIDGYNMDGRNLGNTVFEFLNKIKKTYYETTDGVKYYNTSVDIKRTKDNDTSQSLYKQARSIFDQIKKSIDETKQQLNGVDTTAGFRIFCTSMGGTVSQEVAVLLATKYPSAFIQLCSIAGANKKMRAMPELDDLEAKINRADLGSLSIYKKFLAESIKDSIGFDKQGVKDLGALDSSKFIEKQKEGGNIKTFSYCIKRPDGELPLTSIIKGEFKKNLLLSNLIANIDINSMVSEILSGKDYKESKHDSLITVDEQKYPGDGGKVFVKQITDTNSPVNHMAPYASDTESKEVMEGFIAGANNHFYDLFEKEYIKKGVTS